MDDQNETKATDTDGNNGAWCSCILIIIGSIIGLFVLRWIVQFLIK